MVEAGVRSLPLLDGAGRQDTGRDGVYRERRRREDHEDDAYDY
jgi:hypothetical protein